jgi:hypothetical protein
MKFTLEIDCSNAAFGENVGEAFDEMRRIVLDYIQRTDDGRTCLAIGQQVVLRDSNGNRVGFAKFTKGGET